MTNSLMKALFLKKPYKLELKNTNIPVLSQGEVLIKVNAVALCGTDIHAYHGKQGLFEYPRIIGHEISGEIVEMNAKQKKLRIGDRVAIIPYINCGHCISCNKEIYGACENLKVVGVHQAGGLAEFIKIPVDNLVKLPQNIDNLNGALVEPLAISTHAVRKANPKSDENILIVGMGPIGLGAAEIAKTFGANVILADLSEERRDFVSKRFDYKNILNPLAVDYRKQLAELTDGNMPDTIIDTTGSNKSMESCFKYLSYGGKVVYVGIYNGDLVIDDIEFHKRQTRLFGSRAAQKTDFEYVIGCIGKGLVKPEKFITDKLEFDQNIVKNINLVMDKGLSAFKTLIIFK
ncbi:alcohol dehydrogenase catalytic domain-containing protein [Iocasia frigidifontis]|uniref:Alcohol dehydrogenase catalytic domain-containing protein n=1 Tax=Iocasia fonsfrigidae TaxID=2682810 RepID=A0A8A7K6Q5_9FIRM|nr:zinc-binding alcohol dehydrogenase family protein [Iocasia fonsfrigidae]QTL97396.1 alcohol dehydrogenase catalytic domain-containing protein [Iocasia fonsfrigidae]